MAERYDVSRDMSTYMEEVSFVAQHGHECHVGRPRGSSMGVCGRPAVGVAVRRSQGAVKEFYSVCASHSTVTEMVPLADLFVACCETWA